MIMGPRSSWWVLPITPLRSKGSLNGDDLEFVSPKAEEGFAADMVFRGNWLGMSCRVQ